MKVRLDASVGRAWVVGDSHFLGDYLGCRIEADMVVRIYDTGSSSYVANLQFYSFDDDEVSANARIERAESTLLEEKMPLVEAVNVLPTMPIE